MILTLIGGGAHRLLGTVRSALSSNAFMDGGEIRLYDLDAHRAEVMAEMIKKSPEYQISPVPVLWDLTLEKALDGADLVSVTLLAGGRRQIQLESMITSQYGFMSSDNISYTGAFLALRGIPIALNVARNMEKYCPDAVMLDFANPVSVLSAAVQMATNIKCYGICEGHMNHGWDYNRILTGEDAFDPDYDVLVAGVNHMSFIVDGTIHGRNLKQAVLERIRSFREKFHIGIVICGKSGNILQISELVAYRQILFTELIHDLMPVREKRLYYLFAPAETALHRLMRTGHADFQIEDQSQKGKGKDQHDPGHLHR